MPLYLVSTPIGNLEDITFRALRVLKESALIACEDTRHTGRLLAHFGIATPTISYHEHNERIRAAELVVRLEEGQAISLVTDAGTPGISDPGYRLVVAAIEAGINVVPVPGPTAFVAALIASGLPTDSFLFVGFLPPRKQARRTRLEEMRDQRATLVLYEAPHRIGATLVDTLEILGDRPAALARELTKLHEQVRRGTLAELLQRHQNDPPRGEIVLIIGGYSGDERDQSIETSSRPLADEVDQLIADQSVARNEALRLVARRRGIPRREAYRLYIEEREVDDVVEDEPDQS
jgi:16S rRNA (cytidine1402-2'-O)-methyltransferase